MENKSRRSSAGREDDDLPTTIDIKAQRKLRARRETNRSIWFAMGMFGLVGWAVAIPTILGVALGVWIDRHLPSRFSWTLMFLFIGVVLGSLNAWFWIKRERGDL